MSTSMRELISRVDLEGIKKLLAENPALANEGIGLSETDNRLAHPLHRICDGVITKRYTDEDVVEMAKLFLAAGANVNGWDVLIEKQDTPLIAAAGLHAEKTGILYIEHGANIHHPGCHGGTALHWAAWVGRDKLVKRLIEAKADIHKLCIDFNSTPLLWAVHGYKHAGDKNRHNQIECVRLLIAAGADKTTPNIDGHMPIQFLEEGDDEMRAVLQ